ncbi:MAG: lytic transglycosylase domain-containing protein [Eubacteriales bacterium]
MRPKNCIGPFALTVLTVLLVIVLVVVTLAKVGESQEEMEEKSYPLEYMEIVLNASEEFEVPPEIIYGVIFVESSFRPAVVSSSGAVGLMQLKPSTFLDMQERYVRANPDTPVHPEESLTDPEVNIFYGTCYLAYLYDYFGDWEIVYAAYNGGMGNVREWLTDERYCEDGKLVNIPLEETATYVQKVNVAVEKYKDILDSEV